MDSISPAAPTTVVVHVPLRFKRRSGRKEIVFPTERAADQAASPVAQRLLVLALALVACGGSRSEASDASSGDVHLDAPADPGWVLPDRSGQICTFSRCQDCVGHNRSNAPPGSLG